MRLLRPGYYRFGTYSLIKVVEAWGFGFHLGNVLKYLLRAGKKDDELADLKKARWYLDRYLELRTSQRRRRAR